MTFNPNLPADNSKLRLSAGYIRNNFLALQSALGENLSVFPSGTQLYFYQDIAPPGWSTVTTIGDSLLALKGAAGSTYIEGGTIAGSWQLPDHTLSVDQLPSHSHTLGGWNVYYNVTKGQDFNVARAFNGGGVTTDATGNNQPHNHGNTWRPQAAVGIICKKD